MVNNESKDVLDQFTFEGEIVDVRAHGDGYINDTYAITTEKEDGTKRRYILQRINHEIFKDPAGLMDNFRKVCDYLKQIVTEAGGDPTRETLTIVQTKDGKDFTCVDGNYYRVLEFIENTVSYSVVNGVEDFYKTAKAFGNFQYQLKDFPADTLCESIPNFHYTPSRYETFVEAVKNDKSGRAHLVQDEINFIQERADVAYELTNLLKEGKLPLKVTHNDTKLSNILMDENTNEPVCIIDLDTIMPGLAAYDYGDSIRAGACWTAEDEKDLDKVFVDLDLFEAYTKGFIEGAKDGLSTEEIKTLPLGAKTITLEQGMRFLSDYLDGDLYYKTTYPEQNLDRTRTQLKLVADMEQKWDQLQEIVEKYL